MLASLVASASLRRRLRVFLSKHFYRNKYDYRIEWLRFIETLSARDPEIGDARQRGARRRADRRQSRAGCCSCAGEDRRRARAGGGLRRVSFAAHALSAGCGGGRNGRRSCAARNGSSISASSDAHPISIRTSPCRRCCSGQDRASTGAADHASRLAARLRRARRSAATFRPHLRGPRSAARPSGRHVATHLAQHDADRKLAESRQFEAYHRLTAFVMHDLKNLAAQLSLIVANAEKHRRNPQFVDDAIGTIANSTARMQRLIEQLQGREVQSLRRRVSLSEAARQACRRCGRPAPGTDVRRRRRRSPRGGGSGTPRDDDRARRAQRQDATAGGRLACR